MDFTTLYQDYFEKVYRYHVAHTGNVCDAQDLTSETFKTAYENLHRYRGDGSWGGWLFGIAHHKMADHFRSQKGRLEELNERLVQPDADPESLAFRNIQTFHVLEKLNSLSPERAEALRLRFWGGLTASEAGEVMGKSEAAVKMLVYRGVHELRAVFSNEEQEVIKWKSK